MRAKVLASLLGLIFIILPFFLKPTMAYGRDLELGIFLPTIGGENIDDLEQFENQLGINFDTVKVYLDWMDDFPIKTATTLKGHGALTEITWQPQINNVGIIYSDVVNGNYNTYLNSFSQKVASLNYTVRITLAPEMNGDWASWWVGGSGNSPEDFKLFWRYVVNKFNQNGAANVEWVWAPNVHYWGEKYSYSQYFPGDSYVDYLGLEGYNWGTSQSWSEWQSFREVFYSSYQDLVKISAKQILVTETASTEKGGDKALWITKMFSDLSSVFPKIKGFTWFNMNKETDWRIQSSTASKLAFIGGIIKTLPRENRPKDVFISEETNTSSGLSKATKIFVPIRSEKVKPLALLVTDSDNQNLQSDSQKTEEIEPVFASSGNEKQEIIFWSIWSAAVLVICSSLMYFLLKELS